MSATVLNTFLIPLLILVVAESQAAPADATTRLNAALTEYYAAVREKRYSDALEPARIAYTLSPVVYGPADKNTAFLGTNYGQMLLKNHQPDRAQKVMHQTLKVYRKIFSSNAIELVDPIVVLAKSQKSYSTKGLSLYKGAIHIAQQNLGKTDLRVAQLNLEAGVAVLRSGHPGSLRYFQRAHDIYLEKLGPENPYTGLANFWLGKLHLQEQLYQRAAENFNSALVAFHSKDKPSNKLELSTHAFLVKVYEKLNRQELATQHCQAIGRMKPWKRDTLQEAIYMEAPVYPAHDRLMGQEGFALMEFAVDRNGFVKYPRVVETRGSKKFGAAALKVIGHWRFAPRFVNGEVTDTDNVRALVKFKVE